MTNIIIKYSWISKVVILPALLTFSLLSIAQENIVIGDSLALNSETLDVKGRGKMFTKGTAIQFGDFTIVSARTISGSTRETEEIDSLFNQVPKTTKEFETRNKFSFVLCDKTNDTAKVTAVSSYTTNELQNETQLSARSTLSVNEVLKGSYRLSAFINTNRDSTDTWALIIEITDQEGMVDSLRKPVLAPVEYTLSLRKGVRLKKITEKNKEVKLPVGLEAYDGFLTNGERNIGLSPVSSDKGKKSLLPAAGFEFFENIEPIGAVQYFGGGLLGLIKRNRVWIKTGEDSQIRIILAAAMCVILFNNEAIGKVKVKP
jgi:hypothetical protein